MYLFKIFFPHENMHSMYVSEMGEKKLIFWAVHEALNICIVRTLYLLL